MEFGILGPLQVLRDGEPLVLGGPRQRAVLARLLLEPGRVVPAGVLIEDVWSGDPPMTASKTLQKYVSQLRRTLGAGVVRTSGGGYAVDVDSGSIDAARFEQLLGDGKHEDALALWRGEALADLPDTFFALTERSRLQELRLVAVERRLGYALASGRHDDVVPRLMELAERYPLRERLCGLLMTALYRSGRQVEALQALRRHRRHLAEDVGLDPADELVALEQAILRHDPSLSPPGPMGGTPARTAGNLRLPASSFVGRDAERRRIADALHHNRVITLVGPGGVGKTRLATEVAAEVAGRYGGGVWLVDLSVLADPTLIDHHVVGTLGIAEQGGQDDESTVIAALEHRDPLLLVLDSCEHLVDRAAALVDRIVRTCPNVHVLATSRRPLGVDGELVLPTAPLPDRDACRLFSDRARLAGASRDDAVAAEVAGICRSLDGLPLALELAAGQLRVLGPFEIAERLDQRLQFVSRRFGAPPRQRTLRDMVAWSHDLLPLSTQRAFSRLGVFATTLTLDAAAAVCGEGDALGHVTTLVDHSLLAREPGPLRSVRFRMLDTLRLFAQEKLGEIGEADSAGRAHAEFYLQLLSDAGPRLFGPAERAWADRVDVEEPNVLAALAWSGEHDVVLALRLGVAMWPYWDLRWREGHAVAYFRSVLEAAGSGVPDELRAWALTAMADLVANPGEARLATRWAGEAVELFRAGSDDRGLAAALLALGSAEANEGALDAATAALDQAIDVARRLDAATHLARGLNFSAFVATRRGDHHRAEALGREELATWSAIGSRRGEATALRHVAVARQHLGDLEQAMRLCERALGIWRDVDDSAAVAHVQMTMGDITRLQGDGDGARRLYEEAFEVFRMVGDRRCTGSTYKNLAVLAHAREDHISSTVLFLEAVRLRYELGDYAGLAECFAGLAGNLAATGRLVDAETMLAAADERRRASGSVALGEESSAANRVEKAVRAALPAQRRAQARARGRELSLDEAVAFALALDPTPGSVSPTVV